MVVGAIHSQKSATPVASRRRQSFQLIHQETSCDLVRRLPLVVVLVATLFPFSVAEPKESEAPREARDRWAGT